MRAQEPNVSLEQIPGFGLDLHNWMVDKLEEIFQHSGNVLSMLLKERAVPNTDVHVVKLRCWMIE
jgi:hypothetical protein